MKSAKTEDKNADQAKVSLLILYCPIEVRISKYFAVGSMIKQASV